MFLKFILCPAIEKKGRTNAYILLCTGSNRIFEKGQVVETTRLYPYLQKRDYFK